jgi:hypothetical protein
MGIALSFYRPDRHSRRPACRRPFGGRKGAQSRNRLPYLRSRVTAMASSEMIRSSQPSVRTTSPRDQEIAGDAAWFTRSRRRLGIRSFVTGSALPSFLR